MIRIILIRHGETTWNVVGRFQGQEDTCLSEAGQRQGKQVAEALRGTAIDAVVASPLHRAKVTAQYCAQLHDLPVHTDERLIEINHGKWEGMLVDEVQATYPELYTQWHQHPHLVTMPNGESLADMKRRIQDALHEYCYKYEGKTILVAAHDAVNKVMICSMLGLDMSHFWQIKQDNTCINILEGTEQAWRIVLLNSVSHRNVLFCEMEQKGL